MIQCDAAIWIIVSNSLDRPSSSTASAKSRHSDLIPGVDLQAVCVGRVAYRLYRVRLLDDDRVLRRPLDHGQDMLVAVAIDADRRHQDMVADMQTVDLDD